MRTEYWVCVYQLPGATRVRMHQPRLTNLDKAIASAVQLHSMNHFQYCVWERKYKGDDRTPFAVDIVYTTHSTGRYPVAEYDPYANKPMYHYLRR